MCYKKLIWRSERCKACGWVIACPNPTHLKRSPKNQGPSEQKTGVRKGVCGKEKEINKKNISASHVVFKGRLISRQSHFLIIHLEISSRCESAGFQLGAFIACRNSCGCQNALSISYLQAHFKNEHAVVKWKSKII